MGPTELEGLSRMTIIVDGASAPVEQVEKQLYKLIDVVKVSDLTHEDAITRELALLKVRCNNVNRHELLDIANVFRADVVDMATNSLMLQVVGDEDKINGLIKMCEPYGIRELTRTGTIAMTRGAEDHHGARVGARGDRARAPEPGSPRGGGPALQQRLAEESARLAPR